MCSMPRSPTPRKPTYSRLANAPVLFSTQVTVSTFPIGISRLIPFILCFRPATLLSTLNITSYQVMPKTRYEWFARPCSAGFAPAIWYALGVAHYPSPFVHLSTICLEGFEGILFGYVEIIDRKRGDVFCSGRDLLSSILSLFLL